jgi:hypothetical protein
MIIMMDNNNNFILIYLGAYSTAQIPIIKVGTRIDRTIIQTNSHEHKQKIKQGNLYHLDNGNSTKAITPAIKRW